jgi:hypothetical protein
VPASAQAHDGASIERAGEHDCEESDGVEAPGCEEGEDGRRLGAPFRVGRYHYEDMDAIWTGVVWSLAPTVLVGLLFWLIMRAIMHADRSERKVYARMEAEERARRGLPQKP